MQTGSFAFGGRQVPCSCSPRSARPAARMVARAAAPAANEELGFKTMRRGIKEAANESALTPRFYTTDFDKMEQMFNLKNNPGVPGTTPPRHWAQLSNLQAALRQPAEPACCHKHS